MALIAFAGSLLVACDISQKKPEVAQGATLRVPAGAAHLPHPSGPASPFEATSGDGTVRLFGPGVSRQRQTRV